MDAYAARFAAWAPGFADIDDWKVWARGERAIPQTAESPSLDYADPLYRRRLSQISRMTIQVIHDILPMEADTRLVFVSFRGEVARQFSINRMLAGDGDIMPAAFSLSVFNTPPASAAIALNLEAGYTAVYPGNGSFRTGLMAALAPVASGAVREILLVYADELCPGEYGAAAGGYAGSQGPPDVRPPACVQPKAPLAFAALLGRGNSGTPVVISGEETATPEAFLKYLLLAS
jgi:hypothetical protein